MTDDEATTSAGESVSSPVRHALRNKLAAMRNSVFYIQRSLSKMGVLENDPRVARFLGLIETEIDEADRLLNPPPDSSPSESPSHSGLAPRQ